MIRVVGTDPSKVKIVTCNNCAAILEFANSDVTVSKHRDITGIMEVDKSIECPQCRNTIKIN